MTEEVFACTPCIWEHWSWGWMESWLRVTLGCIIPLIGEGRGEDEIMARMHCCCFHVLRLMNALTILS